MYYTYLSGGNNKLPLINELTATNGLIAGAEKPVLPVPEKQLI